MSSSFQRARNGAIALYTAVSASGCSVAAEPIQPREHRSQTSQPIIHGSVSGAEHDAVVVLTTFGDGLRKSLCTATLVAPNLLLTARHCVSDTDSTTACSMAGDPLNGGTVKGDRAPENLVVFVGQSGIAPNTEVEANGSARGAEVIVDPVTTLCNNDIAFVVIDQKLAAPVAPIRLGPPSVEEKLSAVGWGIDETGALPGSREVRTELPLIGVGPAMYPDSTTYGYGDREFMLGESACSGDSGSPALAKSGAVVGVGARAGNGKPRDPKNQASTCLGETAHAVYTHLGSRQELVGRAFARAGEPIWLEGQPDPRAVKPQAVTPPPPAASPMPSVEVEPPSPSPSPPEAEASASCSFTAEPTKGAVEHAAGLVALLATLVGLRRRLGRQTDDAVEIEIETEDAHRPRMPSLP